MKTKILLVAVVVLVGVVAGALLSKRQAARETGAVPSVVKSHPTTSSRPLLQSPESTPETVLPTNLAPVTPVASAKPDVVATNNSSPKEPAHDPVARVALAFVGMDPEAEAYWFDAINDPTLPANERKNLIEDLNEDGLTDAKNPGPEDLPVILNRMQLIEELSPYAMDQANADAFKEAYKDLLNLANRTIGGGEPVN